jgi:hypothetical protein
LFYVVFTTLSVTLVYTASGNSDTLAPTPTRLSVLISEGWNVGKTWAESKVDVHNVGNVEKLAPGKQIAELKEIKLLAFLSLIRFPPVQ